MCARARRGCWQAGQISRPTRNAAFTITKCRGVTDVISTGGHTISGIGDHAVWFDSGGEIVPSLGAWKGNVSCLVQPDSDVENDTVTYTGKPPFIKIADADGLAYAQKMGKVCADVFAAAS
jgi:hypothetical protein